MLAKFEKVIVKVLLEDCGEKKATLIEKNELTVRVNERLSEKNQISSDELEKSLKQLELDGYFDVIDSDRKGQKVFCITIRDKAKALPREEEQTKRKFVFDLKMKLLLALIGAVATFVIGIILKSVIHC